MHRLVVRQAPRPPPSCSFERKLRNVQLSRDAAVAPKLRPRLLLWLQQQCQRTDILRWAGYVLPVYVLSFI